MEQWSAVFAVVSSRGINSKKLFPGREFHPFVCKGILYCIINRKHGISCGKTEGVISNGKSDCEWTIPFKFDLERKIYVIVKNSKYYHPRHSHLLNRHTVRASVRRFISYEKELTTDEVKFVMELGPANLGVTKARDIMRLKFPMRHYDGPLLNRLLKKGARMHFGNDPDSIVGLMDIGYHIRETGGVFKIEIGYDSRITNIFVMKQLMMAYAKAYGDFIISDGTHNVGKYGLISIFNTLVDGLGLSVMHSYSQFRSEHSEHLIKALPLFSLDLKEGTLMTDDGPAFHIVATHFDKVHLLCTKHYHTKVFAAKSGLGHRADEFEKDMFSAIYSDFGSSKELELHLATCSGKYCRTKAADKFVQSLIEDQYRVCHTHTKWFFSASCKSSQRGEGTNSRIKGGGTKKKELREYNLLQLLQWYLNQVELQEEQSLNMIVKLIEDNRQWSKYVQTAWQLQLSKVRHYRSFPIGGHRMVILILQAFKYTCEMLDDVWLVYSTDAAGDETVNEVKMKVYPPSTPSCSCAYFATCHMPCRHICAVSLALKKDPNDVRLCYLKCLYRNRNSNCLLQIENLAHRWRLKKHPLMSLALARMGLGSSPSICLTGSDQTGSDAPQSTVLDAYQQIPIPAVGTMFHHLMQRAKEVVTIGQRSPAEYRRIMMGLNNLMTAGDDNAVLSGPGILAPVPKKVAKRGRPTNAELVNLSSLKKKASVVIGNKKARECKTCRKNGKHRTDHRTGSKCPFFKKVTDDGDDVSSIIPNSRI